MKWHTSAPAGRNYRNAYTARRDPGFPGRNSGLSKGAGIPGLRQTKRRLGGFARRIVTGRAVFRQPRGKGVNPCGPDLIRNKDELPFRRFCHGRLAQSLAHMKEVKLGVQNAPPCEYPGYSHITRVAPA